MAFCYSICSIISIELLNDVEEFHNWQTNQAQPNILHSAFNLMMKNLLRFVIAIVKCEIISHAKDNEWNNQHIICLINKVNDGELRLTCMVKIQN